MTGRQPASRPEGLPRQKAPRDIAMLRAQPFAPASQGLVSCPCSMAETPCFPDLIRFSRDSRNFAACPITSHLTAGRHWQNLQGLTGRGVNRSAAHLAGLAKHKRPKGARKKQPPRSPSPARLMNCRPLGINSLSPSMRRPVDKAPAPKLVTIWTKQCLACKVVLYLASILASPPWGFYPSAPISRFQFLLNGVA
jgi:hypothetical protein